MCVAKKSNEQKPRLHQSVATTDVTRYDKSVIDRKHSMYFRATDSQSPNVFESIDEYLLNISVSRFMRLLFPQTNPESKFDETKEHVEVNDISEIVMRKESNILEILLNGRVPLQIYDMIKEHEKWEDMLEEMAETLVGQLKSVDDVIEISDPRMELIRKIIQTFKKIERDFLIFSQCDETRDVLESIESDTNSSVPWNAPIDGCVRKGDLILDRASSITQYAFETRCTLSSVLESPPSTHANMNS
jgi:hypothetical protein